MVTKLTERQQKRRKCVLPGTFRDETQKSSPGQPNAAYLTEDHRSTLCPITIKNDEEAFSAIPISKRYKVWVWKSIRLNYQHELFTNNVKQNRTEE